MLDHLPHPIFLEILFRIPVNSLVKCTSVSKAWYSLIKSTEFIDSHLESSITRNTEDPHLVRLMYHTSMGLSVRLHFESIEGNEQFHKQMNIPRFCTPRNNMWLIGYSNGMICYAITQRTSSGRFYYKYLLLNPSIQKYFILPPSNYENHSTAVFVFDSNVNDFKLFAVRKCFQVEVEIYSLKNNSWKTIRVSNTNFFSENNRYIFVEGIIYFVAYEGDYENSKYFMVCFNMADEVFHKIMLPESIRSFQRYPIQYGDTSIAVVAFYGFDDKIELWVMEDCNISGSWIKILDIGMADDDIFVNDIFGVWKGREVLMKNIWGRVFSLDLDGKQRNETGLVRQECGIPDEYSSILRYEETLALLDKGKDISILEEEIDILDYSSDSDDYD